MPNRAALLLSLLCVSFSASAQPLVTPPPPPPLPPPPPAWVPTGDFVTEANALEAAGRRKKRVGAVLMASGGALVLAGSGLLIAGTWHGNHQCYDRNRYGGYYYHSYYYGCRDDALQLAGATTALVGVSALVPGIIEYVGGAGVVDRARRLRQCGGFCW
jgi:hypothetical protein